MGENTSFVFTLCAKSVPVYHFKLAYVVLHTAVNELFPHAALASQVPCSHLRCKDE